MLVTSNHSPDYSLNCTPLSPITITNRWILPDGETEEQLSQEDYTTGNVLNDEMFHLRADIYSYGQLVAYTLTGKMPWQGRNSVSVKGIHDNLTQKEDRVEIPE